MALENATLVYQLVPSNPVGNADPVSQLDNHIRMMKQSLLNNFPNMLGVVNATHTEMNFLVGVTSQVVSSGQKNVPNGIGGLDAAARLSNAQMPTDPSFTTLRLVSVVNTTLASSGQGFQLGAATATNLAMSSTIIQARANGSASALGINPFGGGMSLGMPGDVANNITMYGRSTLISGAATNVLFLSNLLDGGPALGAVTNLSAAFQTSQGSNAARIGYLGDVAFTLRNENLGGGIRIELVTASSATERILVGQAAGDTLLYSRGSNRFAVSTSGANVIGAVAGGTGGNHQIYLQLLDPAGLQRAIIGYFDGNYLGIRTNNVGGAGAGQIAFQGFDSGGNLRGMLNLDPSAGIVFYYQGTEIARVVSTGITVGGVFVSLVGHTHTAAEVTSGVLPVAQGGTGVTTSTGSGNNVLSSSPTFQGAIAAVNIAASGSVSAASFAQAGQAVSLGMIILGRGLVTSGGALSFGTNITPSRIGVGIYSVVVSGGLPAVVGAMCVPAEFNRYLFVTVVDAVTIQLQCYNAATNVNADSSFHCMIYS